MRARRFSQAVVFCLGAVALMPGRAALASTITLEVYDAAGAHLAYDQVLAISDAEGAGWRNDVTYALADATIVTYQPLFNQGGNPAFTVTGAAVGLSLAWRTANTGYSTLFIDNGGVGFSSSQTINFTYRAALDYRLKLDAALSRRADFTATPAFTAADQEADDLLTQAAAALDEPTRGAKGQQALDALARAFELLLHDYGLQRARTLAQSYWWGVTVDRTNQYQEVVQSVSDLVQNTAAAASMRVVFDEGVAASDYDDIVAAAQAVNVEVMGEILDSYVMGTLNLSGWQNRVQEYVDHFPSIDVWEIGNEVNGEWLGAQVSQKLEYAADYVKTAQASDTTVLTFYWQMGTAGASGNSLFQWIDDNVTPALTANIDVIALSTWIGDAPLGIAHDEVYERLHALFPGKQIVMGELGYWSAGTSRAWWWRSQANPTTTVRRALANHMYLANLAFPYSLGGGFWWYYFQEMYGNTPLWQTVNDVYRSIYDCSDSDADTYCDFQDNCPAAANLDQADADGDGVGNVCDLICPAGDVLSLGRIAATWRSGATDKLMLKATFPASAPLDPISTGMGLRVESAGALVFDMQLGGAGAPVQFSGSDGRYAYRDSSGLVGGVTGVRLRENRRTPGLYSVSVKGKNMNLDGISNPSLRVVLDFSTTCAETHADALECYWVDTAMTRLSCSSL